MSKQHHVKRGLSLRTRNALTGFAFMAPWIVGFVAITVYPVCYSLFLSMQQVRVGIGGIETSFVGLHWYKQVIFSDADFLKALSETLQFICFPLPVIVVVSLIIAVLLNHRYPLRGFFRTMFFFPVIIISGPVIDEFITNGISTIGNPSNYAFYQVICMLPDFLSLPLCYVIDNIVIILWFSGVQILMYLSGLQKIGRPIFEAAQIDGASQWEVFWKITLPYIRPYMLVNAIYTVVEMSGFPSTPISQLISAKMYSVNVIYSYSAAISWMYFLVQIVLLVACFLLFREGKERVV